MDTLYPCCAGLDVHKDTVVACLRCCDAQGHVRQEVRTFATVTRALLDLADWLETAGATHVAMESTGVYWRPVYYVLEERCTVLLVNAQHIKKVPGRKTDVKDCQWIAQLLQHGLLKASFVPPAPLRDLRELTRQRVQLVQQKASVANRLQKVLEDANIKLGSVASDVLGKSGRDMLWAMIGGESDAEELADMARGRMRRKIEQLVPALEGRVTEHHRFLLHVLLDQVTQLEGLIGRLESRLEAVLVPFATAVELLTTIPGVDQRSAEAIVAEIGVNMDQFGTAAQLASWAGVCPGNNESAGRQRSGRTPKGNGWLRRVLVQSAWAASHTKGTYLSAFYRRQAQRRGRKRALVALAHTMLVIIYHMLRRGTVYQELGGDYFDRRDAEGLTRRLVRRLESLGHKVTLEKEEQVA